MRNTITVEPDLLDELKAIIKEIEIEESGFRDDRLRLLKKLDSFWHGIQRIYWSDIAKDWRSAGSVDDPEFEDELDNDDEIINIYRAHGESVISALSGSIPKVRFFPEDADNPADILASKAFSRISDLIYKHNAAPILYTKALFILWNQSFVAAYHYPYEDDKFGTVTVPGKPRLETQTNSKLVCSTCGADYPEGAPQCPYCGGMEPTSIDEQEEVEVPTFDLIPKSRQIIEFYGDLNVLVPANTSKIEDAGYLVFYTEQDIAKIRSLFPDKLDLIESSVDSESAWSRESEYPFNKSKVTVKMVWLRPWMFYRLGKGKEVEIQALLQKFPDGCYIIQLGKEVLEVHNESLDSRWTLTKSPIDRSLHADPLGKALISLQETRNDLYSLTNEMARHAIPETFYDSQLIDETKYKNTEIKPGMLFPVKRRAGQSISDSFFQLRTATISKEVDAFNTRIDADSQFVTGAYPSIYGGPSEGSSGTLGEYAMSRNQALQRLRIHWKMLNQFWTELMSKVTKDYAVSMKADEKFVRRSGNNFVNVWIRKTDIDSGKVGQIEPEASDQFPLSWEQKRDLLIQLLQFNNEYLNSAMFHPENANLVAQTLGHPDIYVPGEESRTKQLVEIGKILAGMPADIDPLVDEHPIHVEAIKAWCNSEEGQEAKTLYPAEYAAILQHLQGHLQILAPAQATTQAEATPNENRPAPKEMQTPEADLNRKLEPPVAAPI